MEISSSAKLWFFLFMLIFASRNSTTTYLPLLSFFLKQKLAAFFFLEERIMSSVSQVSGKNQVKVCDVAKKRVQNEVEDSEVARKRRVQEVGTKREITVIDEDSDSHNGSSVIQVSSSKRPKADSTSFKGVVPSQNEHWGAQIYVNLNRIWLGTFRSEKEAAMAYDSAAIKVLSRNSRVRSHRNIPLTNITVHEPGFQSQFSTQVVLNMIKEGSYMSKFYDYLKEQGLVGQKPSSHKNGECGFFCKILFEKVLTPSDVGPLNRLVIPKKYAMMHLHGTVHHQGGGGQSTDTEVVCFDRSNMEWKFRFCYWKSSQSFVFTRGWNAFIKAKKLKAKDTILFFTCQCPGDKTTRFGIDVQHYDDQQNNTLEKEAALFHIIENDQKDLSNMDSNGSRKQGSFRLFGKLIII